MHTFQFQPAEHEVGERLDKVLTERLSESYQLSRVRVQQLIKEGFVTVNTKTGKPAYRLDNADHIAVELAEAIIAPPDANAEVIPEALPLNILYEDDSMAAIDKPAGMVVHPAVGHTSGTLVKSILARWPQVSVVGGEGRAGIVHRLDKDTSGVILIAKTEAARLALMGQFAARTVQKRYVALIEGWTDTLTGEINAAIGRDPAKRKQMAVMPKNRGGREAVSIFHTLQRYENYSLIEVFPKTGRTHQIRVHMAFIGHPIVGDRIYGRRRVSLPIDRHFLHAEALTLTAPESGQVTTVHAPLPDGLNRILERLAAAN